MEKISNNFVKNVKADNLKRNNNMAVWHTDEHHKSNIKSRYWLPMIACQTNPTPIITSSRLLQLSVLQAVIGRSNPAASFKSSGWHMETFDVLVYKLN
jgi:hypothetical protein